MLRVRTLIIVMVVIGLALLPAACGRRDDRQATATETPVPAAPEAATQAEQEVATEAPETEAAEEEPQTEAEEVEDDSILEVATEPLIQVESETFIGDVISENDPALVTLSSSGAQMTWAQAVGRLWNREGELCIYTFDSAATDCFVAPDTYNDYPYAFFWSPGDDYVAFTENPIELGNESDIWIFDTGSDEFKNLTDDGVEGSWASAEAGTFSLDYLPMWNHQDGQIYFWRSVPDPTYPLSLTLSVMRVAPDGGEAELVREVQENPAGNLIWFDNEAWYMDGVSALSPDGRYVAMLVVTVDYDTEDPGNDGLWIVDLEETGTPLRQVATTEELQAALPSWSATPLVPVGLSWQANGESLVVIAMNNDPQLPVVVLYDVDVANGTLTPVVDFSAVPDIESYNAQPDCRQCATARLLAVDGIHVSEQRHAVDVAEPWRFDRPPGVATAANRCAT